MRFTPLFVVFIVLAAGGCASEKLGRHPARPIPAGWIRFEAREAGFSINVPFGSKDASKRIDGTLVHMMLGKRDSEAYAVGFFRLPQATRGQSPEALLEEQASGFMNGCRGKVFNKEHTIVADHPVLRVTGQCGKGEGVVGEVHTRRGHMVSLFVMLQDPSIADTDEIKGFFRSLEFSDV